MTALFVVILTEQWMEKKNRPGVLAGLICGGAGLILCGPDNFILPSMCGILGVLLLFRKGLPGGGECGEDSAGTVEAGREQP